MGKGRRKKYDKMLTGVLVGVAVPMMVFLAIYFVRYNAVPLSEYFAQLWRLGLTFKILSLCGFANLALFFYFIRYQMEKAAKGVVVATFTFAILFVIFEYLK